MVVFVSVDEKIATDVLVLRCLGLYAAGGVQNIGGGADNQSIARARIAKTDTGKPFFENLDLSFSVSDTFGMKVVVFSRRVVGIDIEYLGRDLPQAKYDKIAKRCFTDGEYRKINSKRDFFYTWTAKEAYSKYTSLGLSSFKNFDIGNLNCGLKEIDIKKDYVCFVAGGDTQGCEVVFL
ncbi:MAG: 4'-phosphopantetheinyl transferase superfamily protein [Clostridiales bacterium]|jgi:phosphopantetheinyl transferase|nr:4'-phosphopantetheinyl transferase superfamily protein [Clostridiales bacterium]